jgi:hypothetical protein
MKKYSIIAVVILVTNMIFAQTNISLKVNHTIGSSSFELDKTIQSTSGREYTITRLDYFISNISLHHDGVETKLPEIYILVRNGNNFSLPLGTLDVKSLDSISFYIGVDSLNNHADPSLWREGHALASQDPDMHWGWAGGYRFVAIEGKNGAHTNGFQIHTLGDVLLTKVVVSTGGEMANDTLYIPINADLSKATDDIDMTKVIWEHGSGKLAKLMMANFGNKIFTNAAVSGVKDVLVIGGVQFSENPILNHVITFQSADSQLGIWVVKNNLGMIIYKSTTPIIVATIDINFAGVYSVEKITNNRVSHRGRFVKL